MADPNVANVVGNGVNPNDLDEAKERMKRMLDGSVEKKEEQILKMEASVFQVANYYFVFQGVILSALIQGSSSTLKCETFWLPFCLSLIGAILNFGTLLTTAVKYKESLDDLDRRTLIANRFTFPQEYKEMQRDHKKKKAWRRGIMAFSMILFLTFVALNLYATWMIPRRRS